MHEYKGASLRWVRSVGLRCLSEKVRGQLKLRERVRRAS